MCTDSLQRILIASILILGARMGSAEKKGRGEREERLGKDVGIEFRAEKGRRLGEALLE